MIDAKTHYKNMHPNTICRGNHVPERGNSAASKNAQIYTKMIT